MFFRLYVILCAVDAMILIGSAAVAYLYPAAAPEEFIQRHMLPALTGILLACFLHSMVVFYFFGVARPMRDALSVLHDGVDKLRNEAQEARSIAMFWASAGLVVVIVMAGLGGAAQNMYMSAATHGWLAMLGTAFTIWAHFQEMVAVAGNIQTIRSINAQHAQEVKIREGEIV